VHSDREIVSYITFVKEIHFVLLHVLLVVGNCDLFATS
jgi:hypothetical protein